MSAEIAYIRYWKKNGAATRTGVSTDPASASSSVPSYSADVKSAWGVTGGATATIPGVSYSPLQGQSFEWGTSPSNPDISRLYSSGVTLSPQQTTASPAPSPTPTPTPSPQFQPLRETTTSVPTGTYKPTAPGATTYSPTSTLQRIFTGRAYSANPGTVATAARSAEPADGVWQFMFNPEEIQLESGPDYNRAETWGVNDPKNSGQPLSWRGNKNRKLTFGKVILHGYTFGKRVESLEKGLQNLFLSRDGENGADGPPVLEFVWGRRVFGPCVIQNIRVREQAWDKGILVNAEVSFDLEQVPEWTINDGFVDVARPGRQPTINDPLLPSSSFRPQGVEAAPGEGTSPPDTQPGGQAAPTGDIKLCSFASNKSKEFQSLFNQAGSLSSRIPTGFATLFGNLDSLGKEFESLSVKFVNTKNGLYAGSSEIGEFVDDGLVTLQAACISGLYVNNIKRLLTAKSGSEFDKLKSATEFIKKCSANTKNRIDAWINTSKKCQNSSEQCKPYEINQPCPTNGEQLRLSLCNDGKTIRCISGFWAAA